MKGVSLIFIKCIGNINIISHKKGIQGDKVNI